MATLQALLDCGQSVWQDYIERSQTRSGALAGLVAEGIRGLTSNPSIFHKAIAGSSAYDEQIRAVLAAQPGLETEALFEALAVQDIREAADVLQPVHAASAGLDGYVSLEVSPRLAHDTAATVAAARHLWQAVARPNLMIKVPATAAGIPAIDTLTAEGINVNATLMFSLQDYEAVAQAFLRGLARATAPERVASVASVFVSRVDTAVDKQLDKLGTPQAQALRGRSAIANAARIYARFRALFDGAAFAPFRARGIRPQRPLWGSTGTKDPAYADTLYVETLVGRDTVNTLPPATLQAFLAHGAARPALDAEASAAEGQLAALAALGIDLEAVCRQLQVEGVQSFADAYAQVLAVLEDKRRVLAAG